MPVVKGWCTESTVAIASTGVQVHGGMGFIAETGAAQHLRDARITTMYEGTTGIQANDLVGRKIARDGGRAARAAIAEMRAVAGRLDGEGTAALRSGLGGALGGLSQSVHWIVTTHASDPRATVAGAVPLLKLLGITAGSWQISRAAIVAQRKLAQGDNAERNFYARNSGLPDSMPTMCCRRYAAERTR